MFKNPGNEFLSMQKQQEYEKIKFLFQNRKKFTSPANEFLLHKYRNNRKITKLIFFSNLKKCTSPADEFLLHKCRNKNEKMIFFNLKKCTSPAMSFYYINVEIIRKCRNEKKNSIWKKIYKSS